MTTESLPFGTVTFLFTDIEGSTTLWERYGEAMRPALARHDALLRSAVFANDGRVVKTTGDGIHAVFSSGVDGLHAALQAQRELCAQDWSDISPDRIHVRMGLHTGEAEQREGDYYGTHVNRAARLMSIGHGDQILLSGFTASLVQEALTTDLNLRDLGDHSLRGLAKPERVFQVVVADLPADFPALRSSTVFVGNLPTRVTSFVGRTREIALIRERLHQTRLLTLTGPGGTGKTSPSLRVANDVQAEYEHGVWFVELAPISNPDLVPPTVFTALGLTNAPGIQIDQVLFDYLREKHALLILDNCEHLIESAARLSADLIAGCPQLTILASSREGLGVYGETTIHLPTLTLPDPQTATVEDARLSEACNCLLNARRPFSPTLC
ncbi:MAG: adenylate/guanylate cyclase domain-containing protein [Chloroflexota bacterium]